MQPSTRITEGDTAYSTVDAPDYFNLEGKTCSRPDCPHGAHFVWSWAPGHLDGYRCVCHARDAWEETLGGLQTALAALPEGCDA